jgi:hypothetical protein
LRFPPVVLFKGGEDYWVGDGFHRILAASNCRPTHPDRPYPSCKTCGGRGWTTRSRYEACGQAERRELLKMAAGRFVRP